MLHQSRYSFNRHLLQEYITPVLDDINFVHLEKLFSFITSLNPTFPEFMQTLLQMDVWKENALHLTYFPNLCLQLTQVIESGYDDNYKEPSYHSRKHFMDVCLVIHLLVLKNSSLSLREKSAWWLSPLDCWYLLISAIAHDYGHPGLMNKSLHQQELRSIQLLHTFLDSQTFPNKAQCKAISSTAIIATDPKDRAELVERVASNKLITPSDKLNMLLVEADLFASVLPIKGIELGIQLSEEFTQQNVQLANLVKTPQGRLGFLNTVHFMSEQSHLLGAPHLLKEAILITQSEI
jgi:hypothetical protein